MSGLANGRKERQRMPAERIRVGVIGLGRSGWNLHADALAEHDDYEVTAVADPVEERRAEAVERFGCSAYAEPDELIADDGVDIVVVATPSSSHVPLTLAAIAAGRHVVVEKPMAETVADVDTMTEAATNRGVLLTCYQNRRLDGDLATVRETIASGLLGEVVQIRRSHHSYLRRADWQTVRRLGGGTLSNACAHLLDQVLLMIDDPIDLHADLRRTIGAGDAEDHVKLCLQPRTGPLVEVEASSCVAIAQPDWLVVGTHGTLTGSGRQLSLRWCDPSTWPPIEADEGPAGGRRYGGVTTIEWFDDKIDVPAPERRAELVFYDALAASLRDGADLLVTPQSVRRQIELIERARRQTGFH